MRVRIKQTFRDRDNYSLVYQVGEEREFGESRAQHLISCGLAEQVSVIQDNDVELFPLEDVQRKRGRKSTK